MTMRFKKLTAAVICLAVLTSASIVYLRRNSKNLIERSELVYHGPPLSKEDERSFLWRDEQDLFVSEPKSTVTDRWWIYSLKTHRKQRIEDLVPPAVRDQFDGIDTQFPEATVSPNGSWLAWCCDANVWFWRIGTSEFHECAADAFPYLMWTSDSKYCLAPDVKTIRGKVRGCYVKQVTSIAVDSGRVAWRRDVPATSRLNHLVCLCMDCGYGMERDTSGATNGMILQADWVQNNPGSPKRCFCVSNIHDRLLACIT